MVKHIVIWKIKEEYQDRKADIAASIKRELEGLSGQIPGLLSASVQTHGLASSSGDVMLEACYSSAEDLKSYSVHPSHVRVADTFVRPYMQQRMAFDFEAES